MLPRLKALEKKWLSGNDFDATSMRHRGTSMRVVARCCYRVLTPLGKRTVREARPRLDLIVYT